MTALDTARTLGLSEKAVTDFTGDELEFARHFGVSVTEAPPAAVPIPAPAPAPAPTPTTGWTKSEIAQWLLSKGVTLSEAALMALTKEELLDLVEDIQSP